VQWGLLDVLMMMLRPLLPLLQTVLPHQTMAFGQHHLLLLLLVVPLEWCWQAFGWREEESWWHLPLLLLQLA
jgi:hypothetical protein